MALPATLVPILGRLGLSAIQTGLGLGKPPERPVAKVPESVKAATEAAKAEANTSIRPGRKQAEEAIKSSTADAVSKVKRIATNPATALNAVSAAQATENQALQQEGALDAQYKDNARRDLQHQLNQQGAYEDRAAEFNERQKFQEESQTRASLLGAGLTNTDTALQDVTSHQIMKRMGFIPTASGTGKTKSPTASSGYAVSGNAQKGFAVNPFFHKSMLNDARKFRS